MQWSLLGWSAMSTWSQFPRFQRPFLPLCLGDGGKQSLWSLSNSLHGVTVYHPRRLVCHFWTTTSTQLLKVKVLMNYCLYITNTNVHLFDFMGRIVTVVQNKFLNFFHTFTWLMYMTTGERAVTAVWMQQYSIHAWMFLTAHHPPNWNLRAQWTPACFEPPFSKIWLHTADETSYYFPRTPFCGTTMCMLISMANMWEDNKMTVQKLYWFQNVIYKMQQTFQIKFESTTWLY